MNQPISLNCQNPKKGYLIQKGISKVNENPKERQSFADYVNSLSESQQQMLIHNKSPRKESVPKRHPTLPKLELPSPDIMNKRFVVNVGKCPMNNNYQSPIYRPSVLQSNQHQFHNIQSPRHNSFEIRKSLIPQQRLLPIHRTSVNNISGRSVRDDDMSLFYYKIGGAEIVDQLNEEFHNYSIQHEMISKIDDLERYKQRFKTFLEYIMGKPIFYNLEQLKEKHKDLGLKNRDFNQFKNYLITCFLKVNKGQLDFVFEFSSMIEQYRYCIINSNTPFAIIYNQRTEKLNTKDVPDTILQLAQSSYQKIFQDNTLAPYFIGIEIKQQARKLGKILSQLMAWEQTNDQVLVDMRYSHKGMHLTNVHFTLFKQHLIESMRQLNIQEKQIELVTTRMDGYRSYIINQDSLLDYYGEQSSLLQVQQKKYVQLLKRDVRMQNYPTIALERHSQFILRYLTHQHLPTLTKNDLWTIHSKYNIAIEWIDSFRDNFFHLIKSLNLNALIIQDYEDIWYKLRKNLTQYHSIESRIGKKKVDLVIAKVQLKLQDNENYTEYFKNANYQMNLHLHRIIAFILKDQQIYNSNDLKVIHQSLKIRESTFNLFVQFLKNAMQEEAICSSLIAQAEEICNYYKKSICT
ncbi:unnamed protein product [Paramecium primaurelia]|uniref:Uncharacterized protein n=1 Tax=Paramecium primaurelia TaxID=5886 RepID=A0A8S1MGS7_PARPR|nr:unnamed protein product [Paramecium primaurelia]